MQEIIEILQLSVILFFCSLFASFVISSIFTKIDEAVDKIEDSDSRKTAIFFVTFFQLFVTAVAYFLIDTLLSKITPWIDIYGTYQYSKLKKKCITPLDFESKWCTKPKKRSLKQLGTVDYGIHIVLIILLVEMNSSLKKNLHEIACIMSMKKDCH